MIRKLAAIRAYVRTPTGQVLIATLALQIGMDALIRVVNSVRTEVNALSAEVTVQRARLAELEVHAPGRGVDVGEGLGAQLQALVDEQTAAAEALA